MTLIQNENELRRYIPNAFTTVKGETPLLQKLTPYLESAELWLEQYFTGGVMFEAVQSLLESPLDSKENQTGQS